MIKEYHVSENLFDSTFEQGGIQNNGNPVSSDYRIRAYVDVEPNTEYTFSSNQYIRIIYGYNGTTTVNLIMDKYNNAPQSWTFTTGETVNRVGIALINNPSSDNATRIVPTDVQNAMFNSGSTALPYEPYGNTWNTKSYCKATTGSKTYSNFPIVVRSREQSIPSWSMKGNEQHTGTASPTSPVTINGTGNKTVNIYTDVIQGANINTNGSLSALSGFNIYIAPVEEGKTYRQNGNVCAFFNTKPTIGTASADGTRHFDNQFTIPTGVTWVAVRYADTATDAMMVQGTRIPSSYIPMGYEITISCNGTALSPVYLTEQLMKINDYTDSLASSGTMTRNVIKQVFTGQENWDIYSAGTDVSFFYLVLASAITGRNSLIICTHFERKAVDTVSNVVGIDLVSSGTIIRLRPPNVATDYPSTTEWKQWLADQYAAGTPVTVYYVLATPTTEQVAVPTIPTTSSPTTIDVNTSVKPSEMSLTYDGYKICKPTKIVIPEPSEWVAKSWNGYDGMVGSSIWYDGNNIYYSVAMYQYVLNKSTSTWIAKTWNGLTSFNGAHIWTDGDNIYYSYVNDQYVLNRQTSTWNAKTWNGLTSFDGGCVWTDGNNVYYSDSSNQYILDKATSTWVEKEWNGLTSFNGSKVWFEGNNIYYSDGLIRYVLNKSTSTWSEKVWTNAPYYMYGNKIWSVNGHTFYSNGTYEQYVLDKSTSKWSTKTWTGFTSFSGGDIWTDGTNIYASNGIGKQYVLVR